VGEKVYTPSLYPWRKLGTFLYRKLGRTRGLSYNKVVTVDCKYYMKHNYTVQSKCSVFDVTPGSRSVNHYTINCYLLFKDFMSVPLKKAIWIWNLYGLHSDQ